MEARSNLREAAEAPHELRSEVKRLATHVSCCARSEAAQQEGRSRFSDGAAVALVCVGNERLHPDAVHITATKAWIWLRFIGGG